jgi:hypothetical protein
VITRKRTTTTREYLDGELVTETIEVEDEDETPTSPPVCTCPCRGWWTSRWPLKATWQDNTSAAVPQTFTIPAG